jgi:hypothetical protein
MAKKKTITVAGKKINIGKKFGPKDIANIQKVAPNANLANIATRVESKNIPIVTAAQNIVYRYERDARLAEARAKRDANRQNTQNTSINNGAINSSDETGFSGTAFGGTTSGANSAPGYVSYGEYEAGIKAADLATQKEIENLRQAGQTERQKLVNENNLAVTGMEVKGRLDLQGIINAGYKNIANIERGSNMFSSIMSAFNF